ncbi:MAG: EamA family transporter [Rhizobiales bacterium]|nr:EamA family transporter [Hyphomicrobiales bacterium]
MSTRDRLLAVLAAFLWALTFPINGAALEETPPLFFAMLRFAATSLFIVVVPRPAVGWGMLGLLGLLLGGGQFGFMFVSISLGMPLGLASLLIHTQAILIMAAGVLLFGEPLRRPQAVGLVLLVIGLALLVAARSGPGSLMAFGLMGCAAGCAATGNLLLKRLKGVDMVGVVVWMSLSAPLPLLALSLAFEGDGSLASLVAGATWVTVGAVAFSAVPASILAYAILARLLSTHPASSVAPFFLLVPVFGITLSALLSGERLSALELIGCGVVLAGLAVAVVRRR